MTDRQYQILRDLFDEFTEAFWALPDATLEAFFDRLYAK